MLQIWDEKTPRHVFCLPEIVAACPEARFIFMQRDPRAVIASYRDWQNHFVDAASAGPALRRALAAEERRVRHSYSIGIPSFMWRAAQGAARSGQKLLGEERLHIEKFEDLLVWPDEQIARICDFLGIDRWSDMTAVMRINSSYGHASDAGIDPNAATAWQERLADHEIWAVEMLCSGPMAVGGYLPMARRSHPAALALEVARTAARIPQAFIANRHRMGAPLAWIQRLKLGV